MSCTVTHTGLLIGRASEMGPELITLKDRHDHKYFLGPVGKNFTIIRFRIFMENPFDI